MGDHTLSSDLGVCSPGLDASSDFKSAEPQPLRVAAVDKDI